MKKLIFAILLCALPVAFELVIDYLFYYKKYIVDNHIFTAGLRVGLMLSLVVLNKSVKFWQSLLLTFSFHLLVFPIAYNLLILHQPFDYLGTTAWSDKVEQQIRNIISTPAVLFFKVALLMSAIKFYINPKVYGK